MAADINDKFLKTFNSGNPNVATVASTRTIGATTLSCDSLAGWPTDTAVSFSTYQIDTSGDILSNTQTDWVGVVTGNDIGSLTRTAGEADGGNDIGDIVEMNPTATWANRLVGGVLTEHNQDGTHDNTKVVMISGSQTIAGVKTFSSIPVLPTSSIDTSELADASVTPPKIDWANMLKGATEAASGTTTSTSFTATLSGTPGTNPAVTIDVPATGRVMVMLTANIASNTDQIRGTVSFAVSGANTITADTNNTAGFAITDRSSGTSGSTRSGSFLLTGLTPGSTTFTLQYQVQANTGTFSARNLQVMAC